MFGSVVSSNSTEILAPIVQAVAVLVVNLRPIWTEVFVHVNLCTINPCSCVKRPLFHFYLCTSGISLLCQSLFVTLGIGEPSRLDALGRKRLYHGELRICLDPSRGCERAHECIEKADPLHDHVGYRFLLRSSSSDRTRTYTGPRDSALSPLPACLPSLSPFLCSPFDCKFASILSTDLCRE
jgi:hypothetical protein